MEVEDLIGGCMNLTIGNNEWYNNSIYDLYCVKNEFQDTSVYTRQEIKEWSFIAYLEGVKKYTWEILPHKYCIWLNDSFVIDCQEAPRCIGAMIREDMRDTETNCEIAFAYETDGSVSVYVRATKTILAGQELVIAREMMDDY